MRTRTFSTIVAVAWVAVLVACTNGPGLRVELSPREATVVRGRSQAFTATVTGATDTRVHWTASGGTVTGSGNTVTYTAVTPGNHLLVATSAADPTRHAAATVTVLAQPTQAWALQLGTPGYDMVAAVAIDGSGHVLVAGTAHGDLFGPHQGEHDAFVAKLAPDGGLVWAHQFGSAWFDNAAAVAVDGHGDVYVAGSTGGDLFGPNAGGYDAFVAKLAADGTPLWAHQRGTAGDDAVAALAVDADDHLLVAGTTGGALYGTHRGAEDAFVMRIAPNGVGAWAHQFGTAGSDRATAIAVDAAGDVLVAGDTTGNLFGLNAGGRDAFLVKVARGGNPTPIWHHQPGSSEDDVAKAVAVDALGNVYLAGETRGDLSDLSYGAADAFFGKLDPDGTVLWDVQLGTSLGDFARAIAVDDHGRVLLGGHTLGSLAGHNQGGADGFLFEFRTDDVPIPNWQVQLGSAQADFLTAVAYGSDGSIVVVGNTYGSLAGPHQGNSDALVIKYAP